jgi:ribosomal protein S8
MAAGWGLCRYENIHEALTSLGNKQMLINKDSSAKLKHTLCALCHTKGYTKDFEKETGTARYIE